MEKSRLILPGLLVAALLFAAISTAEWAISARNTRNLQAQNQQLTTTVNAMNNQISYLTGKESALEGAVDSLIGG